MQVRKPFTQYSRVYTGTGKQIARYWVAWKFTTGFRTSHHSLKFRTARAHFVVFSMFLVCTGIPVPSIVPDRNPFRFVTSEKRVKTLVGVDVSSYSLAS